ncbi:hypothetical protein FIBSPDRAFT_786411 [Athelia psychrophila]|uniref:Uncharacterized protein n=1 Tax=Athelia psychrophila TaxID=1759441 RepID=A0A166LIU1_9AGAM|nr:hypothetical protein FIBSPDRAFT_786411 [Fibularhizoctonia sp. CBS 109695]
MFEHASRLYARQLFPTRNGYPLYIPEPPSNRPLELIERGTSIGDVGIVKLDGSFQYAFNIFTPQTDAAINYFGVPVGFHNLTLHGRDTTSVPYKFSKKSEVKTEGKYRKTVDVPLNAHASDGSTASPAGFKLGYQVGESPSESALLTLPDGAIGEDYNHLEDIRTYSIENAPSWYTFISETLGRQAPSGSLYVVTGCDKSAAWGIVTNAENSEPKESTLEFTAKFVAASASYACSWGTMGFAGSIPPCRSADPKPGVKQPHNQCHFIRGFKILLRESVSTELNQDQFVAVESITDHSKIDSLLRQNENSFPGSDSWWSRLVSSSQSGGGTPHQEGADDWIDDVELDPPTGPYHALDTINKYLLETNPQAEVAISHESDWWDLSPGATLANEDDIIRRLASRTPTIESGGVFLVARAATQSDTRPNEGSAMVGDHEAAR